jgi:SNF2 family DNA or RNA helicase
MIRNSATRFFRAANAVTADRKICLTGTPFVNHPRDIQALLEFLKVDPFADKDTFEYNVTRPIMAMKVIGLSRLRAITSCFALRRTKEVLEGAIAIPEKTVRVEAVPFPEGSTHKTVHDVLYEVSRMILLQLFRNREKNSTSFQLVMVMLLRVRQSCCHAGLVPQQCRERARDLYVELQEKGFLDADDARNVLASLVSTTEEDNLIILEEESEIELSPKIAALLNYIDMEMGPDEKCVIFSQWTSHLNLIRDALSSHGHYHLRIDGSMNAEQRIEVRIIRVS